MTYYGKTHSEVLAAGRARQAEQAQREQRFAARVRSRMRRVQMGCAALSATGLLISAWAFALPFWLGALAALIGIAGPWLAVRLQAGILLGLVIGGLASGLPGALLVFVSGAMHGGGANLAAAMGQLLVLFFLGLGVPLLAGGMCGYLRQSIDEDQLQL